MADFDRATPDLSMTSHRVRWTMGAVVFAACFTLYTATLAPGTIYGDPSEYQFIPAIWGIAHPPGYAVYTLVAGIWQRVIILGSVAYRTNLLAAAMGAWAASRAALIAHSVVVRLSRLRAHVVAMAVAVLTGIVVGTAPDLWQHSIHANAHVMSAAITATQVWALVRWWAIRDDRWLYVLALLVGVGVTHHPITVWGIPAYIAFIILCRPRIVVDWKTICWGVLFVGIGILPWLYFPLRSPSAPFGPTDMATWEGFLRHATAQGLRVNLFHFGLLDQPDRALVFGSLLRLQYGWVLLAVGLLGVVRLIVEAPRLGLLWLGFVGGHLAFTLNSVQDVMAYLLHPFVAMGLPIAVGFLVILELCPRKLRQVHVYYGLAVGGVIVATIGGRALWHVSRISLRNWRDADEFVATLHSRFDDGGQAAAFVSDWEHLTPFFYHTLVEGLAFGRDDMHHVYVTGATPWLESVFGSLAEGPTYLPVYRRDVREVGFRLRPTGDLWRVLEPPASMPVTPDVPVTGGWIGEGRLQVIGYDMEKRVVSPGDVIPFTLYARVPTTETNILMPVGHIGEAIQRWTTDSRRLTPEWLPEEIIAERYAFYVPYNLSPGRHPLSLSYANLSNPEEVLAFKGEDGHLALGDVEVERKGGSGAAQRVISRGLTNLGNEVVLASGWARAGTRVRTGTWRRPVVLRSGDSLHLQLRWHVLAEPSTSYTVFIHLMDSQGQLRFGHDYTPLGGAFPSYLWFPKWLPGQHVVDPYRLVLPDDLPSGHYSLEVGMYEMGSVRRIPQLDENGMLTGDRYILGPVEVIH